MKDKTKAVPPPRSALSSKQLEKEIRRLLEKGDGPAQIFKQIKSKASAGPISRFLYNAGLNKTLLDFSVQRLNKGKSPAWPYLLRLFIKHKINPHKKLAKVLFHHWLKNKKNQSEALFACGEWEDISPEFQQLRAVYIQELENKNLSEEKDLLEQLEFVQAQSLIKEEEEIIIKLLLIRPDSKKYQKLENNLKEKKALAAIQEQKKLLGKTESKSYAVPFKKSFLKEEWLDAVFLTARRQPEWTKNLSLFLCFCDRPDKALELLETRISQVSDYWFYLEWAIETRQYTKGLDLISHLFSEVKESAAFFLPLIYMKSQMLYALGKRTEAIEHLTAIIQVQPDYKSAQYFLDKWMKK